MGQLRKALLGDTQRTERRAGSQAGGGAGLGRAGRCGQSGSGWGWAAYWDAPGSGRASSSLRGRKERPAMRDRLERPCAWSPGRSSSGLTAPAQRQPPDPGQPPPSGLCGLCPDPPSMLPPESRWMLLTFPLRDHGSQPPPSQAPQHPCFRDGEGLLGPWGCSPPPGAQPSSPQSPQPSCPQCPPVSAGCSSLLYWLLCDKRCLHS